VGLNGLDGYGDRGDDSRTFPPNGGGEVLLSGSEVSSDLTEEPISLKRYHLLLTLLSEVLGDNNPARSSYQFHAFENTFRTYLILLFPSLASISSILALDLSSSVSIPTLKTRNGCRAARTTSWQALANSLKARLFPTRRRFVGTDASRPRPRQALVAWEEVLIAEEGVEEGCGPC
jgi:hypothetical protein